jgi:hypothetical protein
MDELGTQNVVIYGPHMDPWYWMHSPAVTRLGAMKDGPEGAVGTVEEDDPDVQVREKYVPGYIWVG